MPRLRGALRGASDSWVPTENGPEALRDFRRISLEKAAMTRYKLRVAECLTHCYGNSYQSGRAEKHVKENELEVECSFVAGIDPMDTAIEIVYSCG